MTPLLFLPLLPLIADDAPLLKTELDLETSEIGSYCLLIFLIESGSGVCMYFAGDEYSDIFDPTFDGDGANQSWDLGLWK